jgi:hypothetical protein
MKLLITADLHFRLHWFRWLIEQAPNFDLICIAGDLLDMFKSETRIEQAREVRSRTRGRRFRSSDACGCCVRSPATKRPTMPAILSGRSRRSKCRPGLMFAFDNWMLARGAGLRSSTESRSLRLQRQYPSRNRFTGPQRLEKSAITRAAENKYIASY